MISVPTWKAVLEDLWDFATSGFVYRSGREKVSFTPVRFADGRYYGPNSAMTTRIRLQLAQEYSEVELLCPLQPSEYVAYCLIEEGVMLPKEAKHWASGQWHQKLRGMPGVHISVTPMINSVMEYFDDDQEAKTGLVVDIDNEETVTLASVGLYQDGVVETHVIPRSFWHELRPVFINIKSGDHV